MNFDQFINNVHVVAYWLMWAEVATAIFFVCIACGKDDGTEEYWKTIMHASKALRRLVFFAIVWLVTR